MADISTFDLRELRAELLREEIRETRANADAAEIQLQSMRDKERDRLVLPARNRRLVIDEPIGPFSTNGGMSIENVTPRYIEALDHWGHRDPGEPVEIVIDSPGGNIIDGLALIDSILRLRRGGHHVTTRGRGLVASMAGVVLQAGDVRTMDANAQLLIHELSTTVKGKMSEILDDVEYSKKLERRVLGLLSARSTMTPAQIARKWKRKDWILDADEALKYGFVDVVE